MRGRPGVLRQNSVRRQVIDLSADTAKISAQWLLSFSTARLLPDCCAAVTVQVAWRNLALRPLKGLALRVPCAPLEHQSGRLPSWRHGLG